MENKVKVYLVAFSQIRDVHPRSLMQPRAAASCDPNATSQTIPPEHDLLHSLYSHFRLGHSAMLAGDVTNIDGKRPEHYSMRRHSKSAVCQCLRPESDRLSCSSDLKNCM